MEDQEVGIVRLVKRLTSVGVLESSELGIPLRLEIRIGDRRTDQSVRFLKAHRSNSAFHARCGSGSL